MNDIITVKARSLTSLLKKIEEKKKSGYSVLSGVIGLKDNYGYYVATMIFSVSNK